MSKVAKIGSRVVTTFGEYALEVCADGWLPQWEAWRPHAALVDDRMIEHEGQVCTVAVRGVAALQPFLMLAATYHANAGFAPGLLLVPETRRLFVGIGEHIAIYGLDPPSRSWDDWTEFGFLGWSQVGDVVLMAAEIELAAFDLIGRKLWTKQVEPPWTYEVHGDTVRLDVMGHLTTFPLRLGPDPDTPTIERRFRP